MSRNKTRLASNNRADIEVEVLHDRHRAVCLYIQLAQFVIKGHILFYRHFRLHRDQIYPSNIDSSRKPVSMEQTEEREAPPVTPDRIDNEKDATHNIVETTAQVRAQLSESRSRETLTSHFAECRRREAKLGRGPIPASARDLAAAGARGSKVSFAGRPAVGSLPAHVGVVCFQTRRYPAT